MPNMPVYVTRPVEGGSQGYIEANIWVALLFVLIAAFNVFGWGIFGIITLVDKVVSLIG